VAMLKSSLRMIYDFVGYYEISVSQITTGISLIRNHNPILS